MLLLEVHAHRISPLEFLLAARAGIPPSVLNRASLGDGGAREREGECGLYGLGWVSAAKERLMFCSTSRWLWEATWKGDRIFDQLNC